MSPVDEKRLSPSPRAGVGLSHVLEDRGRLSRVLEVRGQGQEDEDKGQEAMCLEGGHM